MRFSATFLGLARALSARRALSAHDTLDARAKLIVKRAAAGRVTPREAAEHMTPEIEDRVPEWIARLTAREARAAARALFAGADGALDEPRLVVMLMALASRAPMPEVVLDLTSLIGDAHTRRALLMNAVHHHWANAERCRASTRRLAEALGVPFGAW
jgi:hypothetical protein